MMKLSPATWETLNRLSIALTIVAAGVTIWSFVKHAR